MTESDSTVTGKGGCFLAIAQTAWRYFVN